MSRNVRKRFQTVKDLNTKTWVRTRADALIFLAENNPVFSLRLVVFQRLTLELTFHFSIIVSVEQKSAFNLFFCFQIFTYCSEYINDNRPALIGSSDILNASADMRQNLPDGLLALRRDYYKLLNIYLNLYENTIKV